jgi:hypothetical protein
MQGDLRSWLILRVPDLPFSNLKNESDATVGAVRPRIFRPQNAHQQGDRDSGSDFHESMESDDPRRLDVEFRAEECTQASKGRRRSWVLFLWRLVSSRGSCDRTAGFHSREMREERSDFKRHLVAGSDDRDWGSLDHFDLIIPGIELQAAA